MTTPLNERLRIAATGETYGFRDTHHVFLQSYETQRHTVNVRLAARRVSDPSSEETQMEVCIKRGIRAPKSRWLSQHASVCMGPIVAGKLAAIIAPEFVHALERCAAECELFPDNPSMAGAAKEARDVLKAVR